MFLLSLKWESLCFDSFMHQPSIKIFSIKLSNSNPSFAPVVEENLKELPWPQLCNILYHLLLVIRSLLNDSSFHLSLSLHHYADPLTIGLRLQNFFLTEFLVRCPFSPHNTGDSNANFCAVWRWVWVVMWRSASNAGTFWRWSVHCYQHQKTRRKWWKFSLSSSFFSSFSLSLVSSFSFAVSLSGRPRPDSNVKKRYA